MHATRHASESSSTPNNEAHTPHVPDVRKPHTPTHPP